MTFDTKSALVAVAIIFDSAACVAAVTPENPAPVPVARDVSQFDAALSAFDRGDFAAALRLWKPLAEQGDASAQSNLGVMYANGQGVAQDYAAAVTWYRRAAEQGYASAQYNLGLRYAEGQGVPQDYVQAHKWFNLAAATGNAGAVNNRDIVAAKMAPAQIAEAQRLAAAWRPKK